MVCYSRMLEYHRLTSCDKDVQPVEHLFQAPPIPSVLQTSTQGASAAAHFLKYKTALRQQLASRTPLLDAVVGALEQHATELQKDLVVLQRSDESARHGLFLRCKLLRVLTVVLIVAVT